MDGSLSLLMLGALLGVRHALDPDHMVAIGTITAGVPSRRRSVIVGAMWGLGHALTLMFVGGSIVLFRVAVSARVGLAMEYSVALMLIALGLLNLASARHAEPADPSRARPFIVGMMHGMAGSAAIALIVLAAIRETATGMIYLALFGLGTIAGMIGVTALVAFPVTMTVAAVGVSRRWLLVASGLVSVVFGLLLAKNLGDPLASVIEALR
ncbi:MAG TPA: hypothetical protein VNM36_14595 [Gemmatimonadaceae bacterium]|nr:hypothetical protein [Gemmatimonadaceae bacterium]